MKWVTMTKTPYIKLVECYEKIASTSARLEKRDIIADFLKEIKENDPEITYDIALLLQGKIFPPWSEKEMGISTQLIIKALSKLLGENTKDIENKLASVGDMGEITEELVANNTIQKFDDSAYVVLPEGIGTSQLVYSYKEPTELGDKTGTVTFTYSGQEVGTVETTITVKRYNEIHGITEGKKEVKEEKKGMPVFLKIILIILAVVAVAMITLICYVSYKRKQLEKIRRERRRQYRQQRDI